jgi:hypothetical protein
MKVVSWRWIKSWICTVLTCSTLSTGSHGAKLAFHHARYVHCCYIGHRRAHILDTYLSISLELLNLTNEIDADVLANVMEEFVEIFAEQLVPFAVQLCTQLVCGRVCFKKNSLSIHFLIHCYI